MEKAKESGKPQNIVEKMVEGGLAKFRKDHALMTQLFVMDNKTPVAEVVAAAAKDADTAIELLGFVRFQDPSKWVPFGVGAIEGTAARSLPVLEAGERAATDTNAGIVELGDLLPEESRERNGANGNGSGKTYGPGEEPRPREGEPTASAHGELSSSSARGSRRFDERQDQPGDLPTLGSQEAIVVGVDARLDDLRKRGRPVGELLVRNRGGERGAAAGHQGHARDRG